MFILAAYSSKSTLQQYNRCSVSAFGTNAGLQRIRHVFNCRVNDTLFHVSPYAIASRFFS